MVAKQAILDTSYLVSLFLTKDSNHNKAVKLLSQLKGLDDLFITNYIYVEFATILSQRLGKAEFTQIDRLIKGSITELFISEHIDAKTKRMFLKQSRKDVSYVDISSITIMNLMKIPNLVTFDRQFTFLCKEYGFQILC